MKDDWEIDKNVEDQLKKVIRLFDVSQSLVFIYEKSGKIIMHNQMVAQLMKNEDTKIVDRIDKLLPDIYITQNGIINAAPNYYTDHQWTWMMLDESRTIPVKVKLQTIELEGQSYEICSALNVLALQKAKERKTQFFDELNEKYRIQKEYLVRVVHDLKAPANGIMSILELIDSEDQETELHKNVELMRTICNHLKHLLDEVLDYECLINNTDLVHNDEINLVNMLKNLSSIFQYRLKQKNIELLFNIAKDVPEFIYTDRSKLAGILGNLVSNAVKFTQVGLIYVNVFTFYHDENSITLFVAIDDTGIGIDNEHINTIFDEFSRGGEKIVDQYDGLGLGLSNVKYCVELLGGIIRAKSIPGVGSTFQFLLPISTARGKKRVIKTKFTEADMNHMEKTFWKDPMVEEEFNNFKRINKIKKCGTEENIMYLTQSMEHLEECIYCENWDQAAILFTTMKQLLPKNDVELRKELLQSQMAARKGDISKSLTALNLLRCKIKSE